MGLEMRAPEQKVLLITQRLQYLEDIDEERESLDPRWHKLVKDLGNVALVPLSYTQDISMIFQSYSVSGIILSGGNDVLTGNTVICGTNDGYNLTSQLSLKRDSFERRLTEEALRRGVRVFGICRGLQFICLYFGATIQKVSNHVACTHKVVEHINSARKELSKTATELLALFSGSHQIVNSFHNFGIPITSKLPEELEILLKPAGESTIEAFVYESKGMAGVMWHPERSVGSARTRDLQLLNNFFQISSQSSMNNVVMTEPHVIFLCAGQGTRLRPYTNEVPKCMVKYKGRCIIDYSLSVCESLKLKDITFVTGYKAEMLVRPHVNYVYNSNFMRSNMVHSLLCGLSSEFYHNTDVIVSYSDIIYTPDTMKKLLDANNDDISVIVDCDWLSLWSKRMEDPLLDAETLKIDERGFLREIGHTPDSYDDIEGQYIGLIKFTAQGVKTMKEFLGSLDSDANYGGKHFHQMDMTTLLQLLIDAGHQIKPIFINGGWIEIDSKEDMKVDIDLSSIPPTYHGQMVNFGTKAETLSTLHNLQKDAFDVLPLYFFSFQQWKGPERSGVLRNCLAIGENCPSLIVRSSSKKEDSHTSSSAGKFLTVANVKCSVEALTSAIDSVFASYCGVEEDNSEKEANDDDDQVIVQPMLQNVEVCGVICTTDLRDYMPYYVISFEENKGTDGVTSGTSNEFTSLVLSRAHFEVCRDYLTKWQKELILASCELQILFDHDEIDIEFAVKNERVYVLQVRPIVLHESAARSSHYYFNNSMKETCDQMKRLFGEHPNTILDNMMDWNPAEMIGASPSPLSRSLYELLITDVTAMRSRAMLGYRDVSNVPLMVNIAERCYINGKISFTSFIPASLSDELAQKLLDFYLSMLKKYPERRDKVEFEICFTCYEPDLHSRLSVLEHHDFSVQEQNIIFDALLDITRNMLANIDADLHSVNLLKEKVKQSKFREEKGQNLFESIKDVIELTKEYGTLPFANLARYAFVAIAILKSLVRSKHISDVELEHFMQELCTVSGELIRDVTFLRHKSITRIDFLKRYGHLRPGAYDICSKRYDEAFEVYFPEKSEIRDPFEAKSDTRSLFQMEDGRQRDITDYLGSTGLNVTFNELLVFCKKSLEGRESAKFIFTEVLSDILKDLSDFGANIDIHDHDFSFVDIKKVFQMGNLNQTEFRHMISTNKINSLHLGSVKLPDTILSTNDAYFHREVATRPNFITKKSVIGNVVTEDDLFTANLENKIVVVSCADPGWDWLFSNNIGGLITCYGGANSHMAIRAAELSLPAAIGVGGKLFDAYKSASVIQLNCLTETVDII